MGTDVVAEQRRIVAPSDAVVSAVLLVRPAGRQVGDRCYFVIDDRLVAQRRADHPESLGTEAVDQTGEALGRYHSQLVFGHGT